jgi:hypothetical protein
VLAVLDGRRAGCTESAEAVIPAASTAEGPAAPSLPEAVIPATSTAEGPVAPRLPEAVIPAKAGIHFALLLLLFEPTQLSEEQQARAKQKQSGFPLSRE